MDGYMSKLTLKCSLWILIKSDRQAVVTHTHRSPPFGLPHPHCPSISVTLPDNIIFHRELEAFIESPSERLSNLRRCKVLCIVLVSDLIPCGGKTVP